MSWIIFESVHSFNVAKTNVVLELLVFTVPVGFLNFEINNVAIIRKSLQIYQAIDQAAEKQSHQNEPI